MTDPGLLARWRFTYQHNLTGDRRVAWPTFAWPCFVRWNMLTQACEHERLCAHACGAEAVRSLTVAVLITAQWWRWVRSKQFAVARTRGIGRR